jgi:hypothetical protein
MLRNSVAQHGPAASLALSSRDDGIRTRVTGVKGLRARPLHYVPKGHQGYKTSVAVT